MSNKYCKKIEQIWQKSHGQRHNICLGNAYLTQVVKQRRLNFLRVFLPSMDIALQNGDLVGISQHEKRISLH